VCDACVLAECDCDHPDDHRDGCAGVRAADAAIERWRREQEREDRMRREVFLGY